MPAAPGPLRVMGAGTIGCYVGGCLQAAGVDVQFIGRPRVLDALRRHGLRLTDLDGRDTTLPPATLQLHDTPPPTPALTLLCVKSGATADAARQLPVGSTVLSLQNGVSNAEVAATVAPGLGVIAGMVPFNVAELAPGHFHRGTAGELAAQAHPALEPWAAAFAAAGLPLRRHADLRPIQWGKLLLNLNNPVNALSGLQLRAELLDRDCRLVLAALQREALAVL
ncbi:MAG: 2-dehydropantoate 2-reductase N-terminal domain-containing protein, partial [Rubrivivax sp.]